MKFPTKVYEPDMDAYGISYFPRANSNEDRLVAVDFPPWLTELLKNEFIRQRELGKLEAKKEIRKMLGL